VIFLDKLLILRKAGNGLLQPNAVAILPAEVQKETANGESEQRLRCSTIEVRTQMQHASSTLKKIFAETLRQQASDDAPLLAWPLACGAKVAEKTNAIGYAEGVLTVEVSDATWQHQLQDFTQQYLAALKPISAQPVSAIKFVVKGRAQR
jgi:Dna[CI] antecedent, DciA